MQFLYAHVHHVDFRFSSRVRRKTDFYAVNHSEEEKEDLPPKQPKESRKRKLIAVPPVCRRLQFDPEPQQSFPAKADAPPSQALYRAEGCGDAMGDGDECPRNSRGFSRGDKKRQEIKEGDNRCGDKVGLLCCSLMNFLTKLLLVLCTVIHTCVCLDCWLMSVHTHTLCGLQIMTFLFLHPFLPSLKTGKGTLSQTLIKWTQTKWLKPRYTYMHMSKLRTTTP